MQGVWGTLVEMEPQDHLGYSNDYRRDVSGRGLGEARARGLSATSSSSKDPLSSNVEDIGRRGAFVGFGNTAPGTRADVFGLAQRGVKGTVAAGGSGNFFAPHRRRLRRVQEAGLRPRAVALGHGLADAALRDLRRLERAAVVRLFRRMQDKVRNKLTKRQYENEVSW